MELFFVWVGLSFSHINMGCHKNGISKTSFIIFLRAITDLSFSQVMCQHCDEDEDDDGVMEIVSSLKGCLLH